MTLDDIVKNHSEYIKMAVFFTKNVDAANDIVQDMYLKLAVQQQKRGNLDHIEYNGKPSPQYIFRIIQTIFYDSIATKTKYHCCELKAVPESKCTYQNEPFLMKEHLRRFTWYERRLTEIYFNHEHSIRSLAKATNISEKNIWLTLKKTKTYLQNIIENDRKKEKATFTQNGSAPEKDAGSES